MSVIRMIFYHNSHEAYVCVSGLVYANDRVVVCEDGMVRKVRKGEQAIGIAMDNSFPEGCLIIFGKEKEV